MTEYGAEYYESHCGDLPYRRGEPAWEALAARIADELVRAVAPRTFLDAGCGLAFLVEALRARGVDAYGFDVSEFVIGEAPADLRPYLRVASVDEELDHDYDAISCIEVLEHVPEDAAAAAVANFARHTDVVLFSSTPDDFDEPSHVNVKPVDYWVRLFAAHGLFPDPQVDARFVTRHAVLFRRVDAAEFAAAADGALREERARTKALRRQLERFESRRSRLGRLLRGARS